MRLNRFLREGLERGLNFDRLVFVREKRHIQWDRYFPENVLVKFKHKHAFVFRVTNTKDFGSQGWDCERDEADCEILSISHGFRKVTIYLGMGEMGRRLE